MSHRAPRKIISLTIDSVRSHHLKTFPRQPSKRVLGYSSSRARLQVCATLPRQYSVLSIPFCKVWIFYVYIDEVLATSADEKKHLRHLVFIFQRLAEQGFVMNTDKRQFGCPTVEYLDHLVSTNGCRPCFRTAIKEPP